MIRQFLRRLRTQRRIHLDYASTTPVAPEVLRAMQPYFSQEWANPGAIYKEGVQARKAVEDARMLVARTLRVRPDGITFTSGGTESNNLALIGTIEQLHAEGRAYADMEIISTAIEHPSILETLAYLTTKGVHIMYAPVAEDGRILQGEFQKLLGDKTVLVTVAYVNSEVGVVQDIKKITRAVRAWNTEHSAHVRTHTDASQAPLWLSCALDMLGVDLMTLDAGKCYGPKGSGVLARRHGVRLLPASFGGGQEAGLRSGTENVPLVVGCARALARAQEDCAAESARITALRDRFFTRLAEHIPESVVNGDCMHRVANNVNISIPHIDSEYAVIWLDAHGIAASTKSACGVGKGTGSAVVRAMTKDDARALSTIRFTLGKETTERDIVRAVEVLVEYRERMRTTTH